MLLLINYVAVVNVEVARILSSYYASFSTKADVLFGHSFPILTVSRSIFSIHVAAVNEHCDHEKY